MSNTIEEFRWVGCKENFVDQPNTLLLDQITIGRYGGNSDAGQYKNEDGCFVWINKDFANQSVSSRTGIYQSFLSSNEEETIRPMLKKIKESGGRDSTTIVSWKVNILQEATRPSNQ